MRPALAALTAAAAVTLTTTAGATIVTYNFTLDGSQEVPPVNTPGWGTALVTLNTATGDLEWDVEYGDLVSPSTAAHFHGPADFGVNAGIQVDMDVPGTVFGVTDGVLVGSATIDPTQVQQVLDGLWYINVHSQQHPPGEIRGQVVPAPGALALLSLAGLTALRRRRPTT